MRIIWQYAEWNRQIIVREILKGMKWKAVEKFSVAHNYLDDFGILHKGSISARREERVIIPANMRDGMILGVGKGNADWNYSALHGSGRKLKREDVKKQRSPFCVPSHNGNCRTDQRYGGSYRDIEVCL